MAEHALLYHEPDIVTILVLASFLLFLNIVGSVLDRRIYCGLLGQLFLGMAWGVPGGKWLSTATQEVFVQLGYIGLILVVFEGGLSTNFQALKSNLFLSVCVALTGIGATIGISYVLMAIAEATPLQAFAAGAALCSTSLGTTFTVLKTSGLTHSHLGVVLTSAAMLDDVVGLVMVQIISNLGAVGSSFDAGTVIRPIGVSLAFAILVPLFCWLVIVPLIGKICSPDSNSLRKVLERSQMAFLLHTTTLLGFVIASSYAGTSNLFAAYLAGTTIGWYDAEIANDPQESHQCPSPSSAAEAKNDPVNPVTIAVIEPGHGSSAANHRHAILGKVASEDESSPEPQMMPSHGASENGDHQEIKQDTTPPDVKIEGGKVDALASSSGNIASQNTVELGHRCTGMSTWEHYYDTPVSTLLKPLFFASIGFSIPISQMFKGSVIWRGIVYAILMALGKLLCGAWLARFSKNTSPSTGRTILKPTSLYPASILGCAMVARGEIGFLISAVAESRGIFSSGETEASSELFLIVTWAIMLCTIAGPLAVGLLTRRVRRLQEEERRSAGGREDPLGIWGIT